MEIIVFEKSNLDAMYPMLLTRPAFSLTVGGLPLEAIIAHLAEKLNAHVSHICRPYISTTTSTKIPQVMESFEIQGDRDYLFLNASLTPDAGLIPELVSIVNAKVPLAWQAGDTILMFYIPKGITINQTFSKEISPDKILESIITETKLNVIIKELTNHISEMYHPIAYQKSIMLRNIEFLLSTKRYIEHPHYKDLWLAPGVDVGNRISCHTKEGPIVIHENAQVSDFSYLRGPLVVGAHGKILEHSSIKDYTTIGSWSKVGGEVETSIIEAYSNKQHHGFIGHSWVGSWVNLGAGTSNSDLKNTYGSIQISRNGHKFDTGLQFFGSIIGDYTKSAINTGIFTGKIIGVNAMLYGFVGQNVPSFTNWAHTFGQITTVDLDQAIKTQGRMYGRRGIMQSPEDIALLKYVYDCTVQERPFGKESLRL